MRILLFSIALGLLGLPVAAQNPYLEPNNTWISINGEPVEEPGTKS